MKPWLKYCPSFLIWSFPPWSFSATMFWTDLNIWHLQSILRRAFSKTLTNSQSTEGLRQLSKMNDVFVFCFFWSTTSNFKIGQLKQAFVAPQQGHFIVLGKYLYSFYCKCAIWVINVCVYGPHTQTSVALWGQADVFNRVQLAWTNRHFWGTVA